MKRLIRDGRVIYVRHHYGWSFLFITLSLLLVLYAWRFPSPEKRELGVALYYGVPLAIAATAATLRSQLVAIDRNLGRALFIERRLLRPSREFRDLARLSVRLKSRRTEGASTAHHYIWIDVAEDRSFLFQMKHGATQPLWEAERLAADLGRPLTVDGN